MLTALKTQDFKERLVLELAQHSPKNMVRIIATLVQTHWPEVKSRWLFRILRSSVVMFLLSLVFV